MTTSPPWGTPTSAGSADTEPDVASRGFALIVEQLTGSGEAAVWRVDPAPIPAGHSRAEARQAAALLARTFQPRHPFSPRDRAVYRVTEDSYLVIVPGMTKTYHFRVSVAELLG